MRLTVVPSDKVVIKDGKEYTVSDLSFLMQFNGMTTKEKLNM